MSQPTKPLATIVQENHDALRVTLRFDNAIDVILGTLPIQPRRVFIQGDSGRLIEIWSHDSQKRPATTPSGMVPNVCGVCAGTGKPASDKRCICDNAAGYPIGTLEAECAGLRLALLSPAPAPALIVYNNDAELALDEARVLDNEATRIRAKGGEWSEDYASGLECRAAALRRLAGRTDLSADLDLLTVAVLCRV